jgi:serine/threonine protein kinase
MNNTDCLSLAHKDALRANVLHRDLSPGNIIIVPDGKGFKGLLIDWDLSKTVLALPETPRRARRTVRDKTVSRVVISTNMVSIRVPGNSCPPN